MDLQSQLHKDDRNSRFGTTVRHFAAESLDRKTEDTVEERIDKWKGETPPDGPPAEESDDGGSS